MRSSGRSSPGRSRPPGCPSGSGRATWSRPLMAEQRATAEPVLTLDLGLLVVAAGGVVPEVETRKLHVLEVLDPPGDTASCLDARIRAAHRGRRSLAGRSASRAARWLSRGDPTRFSYGPPDYRPEEQPPSQTQTRSVAHCSSLGTALRADPVGYWRCPRGSSRPERTGPRPPR